MSDPTVGQRYTRTLEFEVTVVDTVNRNVTIREVELRRERTISWNQLALNYSQVPAPVVVFPPGTVVRSLAIGDHYTIGQNGYLHHESGGWVPSVGGAVFTSTSYEKVDI